MQYQKAFIFGLSKTVSVPYFSFDENLKNRTGITATTGTGKYQHKRKIKRILHKVGTF
jgi:hypothetical protein